MASSSFGWGGFALRFVFALLLVLLTYNPEGWSFLHWVSRDVSQMIALKALAGVLLAVGWTNIFGSFVQAIPVTHSLSR